MVVRDWIRFLEPWTPIGMGLLIPKNCPMRPPTFADLTAMAMANSIERKPVAALPEVEKAVAEEAWLLLLEVERRR